MFFIINVFTIIFNILTKKIFPSRYVFIESNKITNKYNLLENHDYVNSSLFIDKNIITISPGGYKGFYMMGIAKFICNNYDTSNIIFSGASAGAWISLFMCYKGNLEELQKRILSSSIEESKSIIDIENKIVDNILSQFTTEDFDLQRLFIGITTIYNFRRITAIISNFDNLEDAINCCKASSHIPCITGKLSFTYKNILSFDGGFSQSPYITSFFNENISILDINPGIWENKKQRKFSFTQYTTLFSRDKYNFTDMINSGYYDSNKYRNVLDDIFHDYPSKKIE
jgi:hypothetical protein